MKQTLKSKMVILTVSAAFILVGVAVFSSVDRPVADGTKTFYDSALQTVYILKDGKLNQAGSLMNVQKGDQFKIFSDVSGTWTESNKVFTAAASAAFNADKNRWAIKTR